MAAETAMPGNEAPEGSASAHYKKICVEFDEGGPLGLDFQLAADGKGVTLASISPGSPASTKPGLKPGLLVHTVGSKCVFPDLPATEVMQLLAIECGGFLRPKEERTIPVLRLAFCETD